MWLRSEYAGEVAVLSTWLCALLPWSVSVFRQSVGAAGTVTAVWLRFLPGRFLYVLGALNRPGPPWNWVWEIPGFVASGGETVASYVWIAGTVVFVPALVLSVVYYVDEDRIESWPVDPVRTLGGLLTASGGLLLVASVLLFADQSGTTVPVGAAVQFVLGVALLRAERA